MYVRNVVICLSHPIQKPYKKGFNTNIKPSGNQVFFLNLNYYVGTFE